MNCLISLLVVGPGICKASKIRFKSDVSVVCSSYYLSAVFKYKGSTAFNADISVYNSGTTF